MKDLYEKSLGIVKDAMKDVKHEICITLEDDTAHIVFIHDIQLLENGGVSIDWSTLSEDRKDELIEHVEKCISHLIQELSSKHSKKLFSF